MRGMQHVAIRLINRAAVRSPEARHGPPFIAGSGQFRRRSHTPVLFVQLGILLPFFSERSLEVRHSAWDRGHACANPAAPTILSAFQVSGPFSGAPAREAGEVGASPTHLTNVNETEPTEAPHQNERPPAAANLGTSFNSEVACLIRQRSEDSPGRPAMARWRSSSAAPS